AQLRDVPRLHDQVGGLELDAGLEEVAEPRRVRIMLRVRVWRHMRHNRRHVVRRLHRARTLAASGSGRRRPPRTRSTRIFKVLFEPPRSEGAAANPAGTMLAYGRPSATVPWYACRPARWKNRPPLATQKRKRPAVVGGPRESL